MLVFLAAREIPLLRPQVEDPVSGLRAMALEARGSGHVRFVFSFT